MNPTMTRRAALFGAAVSTAAIAVPALAPQPGAGKGQTDLKGWLDTADPTEVADFLAKELAKTLNRIRPGEWVASMKPESNFALIHNLQLTPRKFIVTDVGARTVTTV